MTNPADRARSAEIGLHRDARPQRCAASPVMLAIPDWVRKESGITFDFTSPEFGYDEDGQEALAIDACLAPAVRALWEAGVVTLGCCCGHSATGHGVISVLAGHVR